MGHDGQNINAPDLIYQSNNIVGAPQPEPTGFKDQASNDKIAGPPPAVTPPQIEVAHKIVTDNAAQIAIKQLLNQK